MRERGNRGQHRCDTPRDLRVSMRDAISVHCRAVRKRQAAVASSLRSQQKQRTDTHLLSDKEQDSGLHLRGVSEVPRGLR
ncbi:hypothetical protein BHE74_00042573 [Ensete ventricosum]|nr:hypothetical protein BHE74_00042573 [Ensete ventricosum]